MNLRELLRRGKSARGAGLFLTGTACLAALVMACGGGSAATSEPGGGGSTAPDAVAYANCMRANGVQNFPDPMPNGGFRIEGSISQNPNFARASQECAHLRPVGNAAGGEVDSATLLEFARCMRENGVPNFPDPSPSASGGLGAGQGGLGGVNTSTPAFREAATICQEKTGVTINIR